MCPPVMAMGRPQMTMRGPGASWRRMPSRSENATCPLAPFSRSVVTPECRSVRAFFAACKSRMSSSSLATSSPSVPSPGATRCVCASTRPGRIVPSAYSRRSTEAPSVTRTSAWRPRLTMRSPSTSRAACSMGRAPVPSRRRAAVISVKRAGVSVMRSPPDGWWRNAAPTVAQAGRQWTAPSRVAENAEPGAGRRRWTTAALAPGPIRLLAARRLQELERRHAELIRGAGRDPEVEVASASRRDDVADSLDHVSDGLPGGVHGCDLQVDVLGGLAVVVVDVPREPGYARLYRLGRPFDVEILVPERRRLPGCCRVSLEGGRIVGTGGNGNSSGTGHGSAKRGAKNRDDADARVDSDHDRVLLHVIRSRDWQCARVGLRLAYSRAPSAGRVRRTDREPAGVGSTREGARERGEERGRRGRVSSRKAPPRGRSGGESREGRPDPRARRP